MGFKKICKLPLPDEIKEKIPVSNELKNIKNKRDREILDIFNGKDNRFIIIVGPCSAHDENAVCEYISRLSLLQQQIADKIVLIPRVYTNKPRTTGEGYKGMAHQPDLYKKPNIDEGIKAIRKMHIKALSESHLTVADEMLYPDNHPYLDDVISYVAVGARSVENQQHRLTASGLDIPVGMKNPTSGDMKVALNSVYAAQIPHIFSYNGFEVETEGNPYAHLIIRGAVDHYGQTIPNYHYEDLVSTAKEYEKKNLNNPAIIVDTNHDNSGKKFREQPRICMEVLQNRKYSSLLKKMIKGFMIESYLEEGNQKAEEKIFGKSITDPCLDWKDTEKLVKEIAGKC